MCQQKAQESSSIEFLHQAENYIQVSIAAIAAFFKDFLLIFLSPTKKYLNVKQVSTEASKWFI
jgi:hypothetical protein